MNPSASILVAAFTAMFGALVLVISQVAQKLFIEPIQDQKKAIGEIAFYRILVGHMCETDATMQRNRGRGLEPLYPIEPREALKTLRTLDGRLQSSLVTIPLYDVCARCNFVKNKILIERLVKSLVGWSNSIQAGDNRPHQKEVDDILGMHNS